ncbi:MAG: ABC transporter ATP-binding protein [Butyrivibrio sp.]|nr:ABC transporter ATP-binding protein [Butyrivibrio sp.]
MKIYRCFSSFVKCYCYLQKKYCFWIAALFKVVSAVVSFVTASKVSNEIAILGKGYPVQKEVFTLCVISILFCMDLCLDCGGFRLSQTYEKETRVYIKKAVVERVLKGKVVINEDYSLSKLQAIIMTDCISVLSYIASVQEMMLQVIYGGIAFCILTFISPGFTGVVVIAVVLYAYLSFNSSKKLRKINEELVKASDKHFAIVKNIVSGTKTIKNALAIDIVLGKFKDNLDEAKRLTIENENAGYIISIEGKILKKLWIVGGIALLIYFVEFRSKNVSEIIMFFIVGRMFCEYFISIIQKNALIKRQIVSVERFLSVMEYENDSLKKEKFPVDLKKISIRNLTFKYYDKTIFEDSNYSIGKGLTLITGKNGTGKTTLLNIIAKCFDDVKGEVLFDQLSASEIDGNSFYENVTACFHNDMIFDWTIAENILLKLSPSDEEYRNMSNICEKVGFMEDIIALNDGFNTKLSDIRDFSYGQRKKYFWQDP